MGAHRGATAVAFAQLAMPDWRVVVLAAGAIYVYAPVACLTPVSPWGAFEPASLSA